jgi:hypothetical protein
LLPSRITSRSHTTNTSPFGRTTGAAQASFCALTSTSARSGSCWFVHTLNRRTDVASPAM